MSTRVELYDGAYGNYGSDAYTQVRIETYGQDFGQTSWVTTEESSEIPKLLQLKATSLVLEVGCGSGVYALHLAGKVDCRIVGVDVNVFGVRNANRLASERGVASRVQFEHCDASTNLHFDNLTFDAVFSNDAFCHLPGRANVLCEMFRILKPGGRFLFSDALVVGGILSNEEITTRSSIGFYLYSPPGVTERLIAQAGFQLIRVMDTTENAANISTRWHQARERRKTELAALEGSDNFESLQRFLRCVHGLTAERRLLRYLYLAEKRC